MLGQHSQPNLCHPTRPRIRITRCRTRWTSRLLCAPASPWPSASAPNTRATRGSVCSTRPGFRSQIMTNTAATAPGSPTHLRMFARCTRLNRDVISGIAVGEPWRSLGILIHLRLFRIQFLELQYHVKVIVKQQQLLTVLLPMHALAIQVTHNLPYLETNRDVHLFAIQQRQLWIQGQTYVNVKRVIIR